MALYDSADLLQRLRDRLARPSTDEALPDAMAYRFLGDAQRRLYELLAAHAPEAVLGAPVKLTTADSGATYTFGTDGDGANLVPLGGLVLLASPTGPPIYPASDFDAGTDGFLWNGATIRWPGGRSRTFADGPYARFVAMPTTLDGSTAPTLQPKSARELIVYEAAALAAERLGMDSTPHRLAFDRRWPELLLALKTQFSGAGRRAYGTAPYRWTESSDLGGVAS